MPDRIVEASCAWGTNTCRLSSAYAAKMPQVLYYCMFSIIHLP